MTASVGSEVALSLQSLIERKGRDAIDWPLLGELGLLGIAVPEEHGGLGLDPRDAVPAIGILAENLVNLPYLECVLLPTLLLNEAGGENAERKLRQIAEGTARVALAIEDGKRTLTAKRAGDQWCLDGDKVLAIGDANCDACIVIAASGHDRLAFLLDASELDRQAYSTIDELPSFDLAFKDQLVPQSCLLPLDTHAIDRAMDFGMVGLCAQAAAITMRLVTDTRDYCRNREQFGQSIASFQVIQHRLVDMYMEARRASAALAMAQKAISTSGEDRIRALSAAKVTICDAGRFVGQNAVQLHGGMGMTSELSISHLFKKLTAIESTFGTRDRHLQRYAQAS